MIINQTCEETELLGELLASRLLFWQEVLEPTSCAACGEKFNGGSGEAPRHAVAYGKPVGICDRECYEMLLANWQPTKGRI